MVTKVSKWGNSFGIRIPKRIMNALNLQDGSTIEIEERNGTIVLAPKEKDVFTMDDLIEGMTEEGVMDQFESYEVLGREIID